MLQKLRFDPSQPIIARSAGRALAGSLLFSMVNLIQQHLRAERFGTRVEAGGIDALNDAAADADDKAEAARVRVEQGFAAPVDYLALAAKMKLVYSSIFDDLEKHAQRKAMLTDASRTIPDPFQIPSTLADSIDFQLRTKPQISEARIRAEAKALNVSEEDIRIAVVSRHTRQIDILRDNRADVERIFENLTAKGSDGHPLGAEADEEVFMSLPAMVQLRCAAAADKGLFRARNREIELHLSGNKDAGGNIAILDGTRRDILAMVGRWMDTAKFKAEVEEAASRGSNMPQFAPAPHVQAKDEVEVAKEKKAA